MGWSCNMLAGKRLDLMHDSCYKNSGINNVWAENGKKYMLEVGREQRDGSITGTIYKYIDESRVLKSGSLKINPDGTIARAPKFLKKKAYLFWVFNNYSGGAYHSCIKDYIPLDEELDTMRKEINNEYLPGGLNHHIMKSKGFTPYVTKIIVVDLDANDNSENSYYGKKIVQVHSMPQFEIA